jgi:hypothetical protein
MPKTSWKLREIPRRKEYREQRPLARAHEKAQAADVESVGVPITERRRQFDRLGWHGCHMQSVEQRSRTSIVNKVRSARRPLGLTNGVEFTKLARAHSESFLNLAAELAPYDLGSHRHVRRSAGPQTAREPFERDHITLRAHHQLPCSPRDLRPQ